MSLISCGHRSLAQGAEVTGLDISAEVLRLYCCKWPQTESIQASIFNNSIPDSSFDAVFIVGGLHHLHPEVARAVREIYRILKPGGWFGFTEPHAGSIPDLARKFWYRFDKLFEENEAAIDLEALEAEFARHFEFIHTRYCGNVAYLFVFSSMVFRIPPKFKKYYTPLLLRLEKLINQFQNKRLACFVVGQWRKIG